MANLISSLVNASQYQQEASARGAEKIGTLLRERRFNDLGNKLMQQGDYSPEGFKKFAQENQVSPQEFTGLLQMLKSQQDMDPLVQVETSDPEGNTFVQSVPRSQTVGQKFQTGVAEKEAYFNPESKETRLYPKGSSPDAGFYPVSTANAVLNQQAQRGNIEYREGRQDERARLNRESRGGSSGGNKAYELNRKHENDIANGLGITDEGVMDKDTGEIITDKIAQYNYFIAKGTPDQKGRAKMGLNLYNNLIGYDQPEVESGPVGTLNMGGLGSKSVKVNGQTIMAVKAPDGKYYYRDGGKTYLVEGE